MVHWGRWSFSWYSNLSYEPGSKTWQWTIQSTYLENKLDQIGAKFPGCGIKVKLYIKSTMKRFRTTYATIYDKLNKSGFGWDDKKKKWLRWIVIRCGLSTSRLMFIFITFWIFVFHFLFYEKLNWPILYSCVEPSKCKRI